MSALPRRTTAAASSGPAAARPLAGLTVGVIGAGRVGAVLGAALADLGHPIAAVTGHSPIGWALLPRVPRRSAADVVRAADLVIIAVPDDALAGLAARLAEVGAFRADQIVAHTSGAHGTAVLDPASAAGAWPLALHPAMTFTGQPGDLRRLLAGISFGLSGPDEVRPLAEALVRELGGTPEWIPEERRTVYHAALAHGANHLVTLVNDAVDRLREAGVRDPRRVLEPLLRAALDNALALGDAALTGPVSRGDAGTVARHLDTLTEVAPDTIPSYLAMARRTADRAIAAGRLAPDTAGPLLDVLATGRGLDSLDAGWSEAGAWGDGSWGDGAWGDGSWRDGGWGDGATG